MAVARDGGDSSQWPTRGGQKRRSNNQPEVAAMAVARGCADACTLPLRWCQKK